MKETFLRSAAFGGVLLMFAGMPALGQETPSPAIEQPAEFDGQKFTDPDRLVDTFMADDQAALDDSLAELEPVLDDAQGVLDQAVADFEQVEADLSEPLNALTEAQAGVDVAQQSVETAEGDLATAQDSLADLQVLPPSPESAAAIAALEADIVLLDEAVATAEADLDQANQELAAAEVDAAEAQALLETAQTVVDEAQETVDLAQAEIDAVQETFDTERAAVETLVAELTAEQLFALNRSLNNALSTELLLKLGTEQLAAVIEGDYNKQQINFLTKAFESEAKFLRLAEETGNDRFLAKAEAEKSKFLSRIDRFSAGQPDAARGIVETASGPGAAHGRRSRGNGGPAITKTLGVTSIDVSAATGGFMRSDRPSGNRPDGAPGNRGRGVAAQGASTVQSGGSFASSSSGNSGSGNGNGGNNGGGNPNAGGNPNSGGGVARAGGPPDHSNAGGKGKGRNK